MIRCRRTDLGNHRTRCPRTQYPTKNRNVDTGRLHPVQQRSPLPALRTRCSNAARCTRTPSELHNRSDTQSLAAECIDPNHSDRTLPHQRTSKTHLPDRAPCQCRKAEESSRANPLHPRILPWRHPLLPRLHLQVLRPFQRLSGYRRSLRRRRVAPLRSLHPRWQPATFPPPTHPNHHRTKPAHQRVPGRCLDGKGCRFWQLRAKWPPSA